ncbi:MAG: hypothetical protein RR705_02995 [Lachnospiraceae bacterium]
MKAKVLGCIVSRSKQGNEGTTLFVEIAHDTYRAENAIKAVGFACEQEYIRGDYSGVLKVGTTVNLIYGKGFEGKAVLTEIIPITNEK